MEGIRWVKLGGSVVEHDREGKRRRKREKEGQKRRE
tara:strand:- start:88 stop:195 length:108 start_codon:yes stop_codon:yes gene_type:complete